MTNDPNVTSRRGQCRGPPRGGQREPTRRWLDFARSAALLATALLVLPVARAETTLKADHYAVTLSASAFYARELSQVEFRVVDDSLRDADGLPAPVNGATIRCVITMPDMPGMAAFDEIAHSEGSPGVYGVHPDFQHGGRYRLALSLYERAPGSLFSARVIDFTFDLTVDEPDAEREHAGRVRTYSLELERPEHEIVAGTPTQLRMHVLRETEPEKNDSGAYERTFAPVSEFELRHERLAHLFIVRDDLGAFAHDHPSVDPDGTMRLDFTFDSAGTYRLFADVAPRGAGGQVVSATVNVAGRRGEPFDVRNEPVLESGGLTRLGRYAVAWEFGALEARKTSILQATVTDRPNGRVLDLDPYLGALGHLVLVHEDGETFAHAHPDERAQRGAAGERIPFVAWLPKPGIYRAWAQFQYRGVVQITSFVLRAR